MAGYYIDRAKPIVSLKDALNAQSIPFTVYFEDSTSIIFTCPTYFGNKFFRLELLYGDSYIGDSYISSNSLGNQKTVSDNFESTSNMGQGIILITPNYFSIHTNAEPNLTSPSNSSIIFCKNATDKFVLSFSNASASLQYSFNLTNVEQVLPLLHSGHIVYDNTGKFICSDIYLYEYTKRMLIPSPLVGIKNVLRTANNNWAWESYGNDSLSPVGYSLDERYNYNTTLMFEDSLVGGVVV